MSIDKLLNDVEVSELKQKNDLINVLLREVNKKLIRS